MIGAADQFPVIITFRDEGEFVACRRAERLLDACGFSVGYGQRGAPRGILHGPFDIQKWRNLSRLDRDALHGRMTGDMRTGPVAIAIYDTAPADARDALCVRAMTEGTPAAPCATQPNQEQSS